MPGARGHVNHPNQIVGHLVTKPGAIKHLSRKGHTDMPALAGNKVRGRGRGRGPAQGNLPVRLPSGVPHVLPQSASSASVGGASLVPPTLNAPGPTNPTSSGPPLKSLTGNQPRTPGRGRGAQGNGQGATKGKGIGLGGAALPGPGGRQLAARVSSGKITSEQAQRTMQQRQTLAKALGPNWRDKLSVGGQSFAQVNAGLKKSPGNAKLAALRKRLIANRSSLLESARKKNGGREAGKTEGGE